MARPAKSVKVKTGAATKEELSIRAVVEDKLRGPDCDMEPPEYLTNPQKEIFVFVQELLRSVDMLGRADVYMLSHLAVAIEREAMIDEMINENNELMWDMKLMSAREKYDKQFLRCCSELCLSPAARAKISITAVNAQKDKADPLMAAIGGEHGD